jgi:hypothetical protein
MRIHVRRLAVSILGCALVATAGCGGSTSRSSGSTTARSATAPSGSASTLAAPGGTASRATASTESGSKGTSGAGPTRGGRVAALTRSYGTVATFGSEAKARDRAAILATLHGYLSAIATSDWGAACGQLSALIRRELELLLAHAKGAHGGGCSTALRMLLSHTPDSLRHEQSQLSVIGVRVDGPRAFVLYHSPALPHAVISMLRQAGQWKAGVLAASNIG